MRLTKRQASVIKQTIIRFFGEDALIFLFGSRIDDDKRGGDIDLYVECPSLTADDLVDAKISALVELKKELGEQKIDLLVNTGEGPSLPIFEIARQQGISL